jgi:dihydrofolate reductase
MRRVRYGVGMSLNGFIADDQGGTDFLVSDSTYDPAPFFASIDTVLMGRLTYEVAVRQGMRAYNGLQNFVVSRTLSAADYPEVTIIADDVEERVAKLRRGRGKDIWLCGGGVLLASLLAAGLVDTVELGISPKLLTRPGAPMLAVGSGLGVGSGTIDARLPASVPLTLTHHRALPSGLIILEYAVRGAGRRTSGRVSPSGRSA